MTVFNPIERATNSDALVHNSYVNEQSNSITQSLTEPSYYHRDYENDVKNLPAPNSLLQNTQRVALIALPFLALYKPLGSAISIGMNTTRTISCLFQTKKAVNANDAQKVAIALFQTTLAAIAVASTIFGNVYGMAITSGHDVLTNLYEMTQCLQNGQHEKAFEKFLHAVNSSLYLTVILHGSLEIIVISLAAQILLEAYNSQDSFRKFKNSGDKLDLLEGFAHLAMAGIRGSQFQTQFKMLQMKQKLQALVLKQQKTEKTIKSKNSDENTKLGTVIQASNVQHTMYEGREILIGYYPSANIKIITIINDPTGVFIPGSQYVFQNDILIASSNSHTFEVVNGIKYVKHFYSDCYVYSTEQTQFVVSLDMQAKNLSFTMNGFLSELQKKNLAAILKHKAELTQTLKNEKSDNDPQTEAIARATEVAHGVYEGMDIHVAWYYFGDITILTIINDPSGKYKPGSQFIFQNDELLDSNDDFTLEVINGIQYIKHIYEDITIFSTETSQFVILNNPEEWDDFSLVWNSVLARLQQANSDAKDKEKEAASLREKQRLSLLAAEIRMQEEIQASSLRI